MFVWVFTLILLSSDCSFEVSLIDLHSYDHMSFDRDYSH